MTGVMLKDKCEFSKSRMKFQGQVIEAQGERCESHDEPSNVSQVRRFLGMTNHLGKFLHHLAERTLLSETH